MKQMMTVICSATLAACGSAPAVQPQSEYQVMTISTTDRELQTIYSAAIRGRQDIDIYPQVSGTLTKLCVEEGQTVRRGQVLFIPIWQPCAQQKPMWKLPVPAWPLRN